MSRATKRRRGLRRLARMYAVYSVLAMMLLSSIPVLAVAPPGSMSVPDPEDWGIPSYLAALQEKEGSALDQPDVVSMARSALDPIVAKDGDREPATGPYSLHDSTPFLRSIPTILKLVPEAPNGTALPGFLQLLLDQPLRIMIFVRSGEHENWVETFLRPDLDPQWDGLLPRLVNWQRWSSVNVDNDTTTGDVDGNDMRLRIAPVLEQRGRNITLIPPRFEVMMKGGVAVEVERLGSGSEDLPIDVTFMKSFRYSGINYTWFIEYDVDHIPEQGYMSITADQVNITVEQGRLMEIIQMVMANQSIINGTQLGQVAGPYTIYHTSSEDMVKVHATLGYTKITSSPDGDGPLLAEASWITARVDPASDAAVTPRTFSLWFDSPAFNRTFDQIIWTADGTSDLELAYFDNREDDTQVRAMVPDAPPRLAISIGEATEDVGRVAKIHFTASETVPRIVFDEWDFIEGNRRKYLHTHVELVGLPMDIWLNGTLDVGGQPIEYLRPDPTVRSFIPQMMDTLMVGLASKLFNIGRTVRSLPENLLNMADKDGYTSVEFTNPEDHLVMMELWLTSDKYAMVSPGTDFFAFYNNSIDVESRMVQTGFSGRMLDLRAFHADFRDRKMITLESRYNREFRALFIDEINDANASILFSNIPRVLSLELTEDQLVYMGESSVDRIQYTSAIADQFIRMRIDGVPGGVNVLMGEERVGVDVLAGEIDALELQITDGTVRQLVGDHLLIEVNEDGTTAASLRISNISSIRVDRGEGNQVSLRTGGNPFKVLVEDETEGFHMRAYLDPLPSSIQAELSDVLGLSKMDVPTLQDVTSVLEFSSIIFAISDVATGVLEAVGDATVKVVDGLGTFSSDLAFSFDGDTSMDLFATIVRAGGVPVESPPWIHGLSAFMEPSGDKVLVDAKVALTGLPPKGSIELHSTQERTILALDLAGFAPRFKELGIYVDGASRIPGGGGKDFWLYMADLASPMDLKLDLDVALETEVGGRVEGDIGLETSSPLGPLHMYVRNRGDNVATVEALLSNIPREADLHFVYEDEVILQTQLSQTVTFAFVKLSRNLSGHGAPSTVVTLHDVPTQVDLGVVPGATYDMDNVDPMANLPTMTVGTSDPGLDVLVDIEGPSMGNRADVFLDARNLQDLSMVRSGKEYRLSAEQLGFIHISVAGLQYTNTISIDRLDIVANGLTRAAIGVDMVFGLYPLISVDDLRASGLQLGISGSIELRGKVHALSVYIIEVPLSLRSFPASHRDGVALGTTDGQHRLFVPAPMGTLMGTLMG